MAEIHRCAEIASPFYSVLFSFLEVERSWRHSGHDDFIITRYLNGALTVRSANGLSCSCSREAPPEGFH